ncbi:TetR/AcrR family transcriptional regulator [Bacillus tianshenii]|uniref:TetR/AcrR family transcriptional regulator n=1 Tax=Sutcliffiella tianshenii TaxID=1463404 RepID=UPI001CD622EB|nr:TetR/AcrR family transcriptional regulator C-terminal domain-containing protein [Bacillus tianshenii]MCA1321014.1 TetR/AcrR family transcriptional regulator [Bacillus tianshenii]
MDEKQDLRVIKTKRAIREALLKLVKEKDFAKVSVRDLCAYAEINRGTFYLHYQDKYDLLERIELELLDTLRELMSKRLANKMEHFVGHPEFLLQFATELFRYVDKEAEVFSMLLLDSVSPMFPNKLKDLIRGNFLRAQKKEFDLSTLSIPFDYLMAYATSANVGLLQQWLAEGRKNPPEKMAEVLVTITLMGPVRAMGYKT